MSRKKRNAAGTGDPIEQAAGAEVENGAGAGPGARPIARDAEVRTGEEDGRDQLAGQGELEELRARLEEEHDRLLRTAAELENLRKRSRRELAEARRFAQADVLRPLLEVLDNFERALQHADPGTADAGPSDAPTVSCGDPGPLQDGSQVDPAPDSFRQGVVMIARSFRRVLGDCGVSRIEAVGRSFDPALHEAVGQAPAGEDQPSGTVLAELQAGYTFDDLVLRASRVIVAQ